jgi:hypothetical protein
MLAIKHISNPNFFLVDEHYINDKSNGLGYVTAEKYFTFSYTTSYLFFIFSLPVVQHSDFK